MRKIRKTQKYIKIHLGCRVCISPAIPTCRYIQTYGIPRFDTNICLQASNQPTNQRTNRISEHTHSAQCGIISYPFSASCSKHSTCDDRICFSFGWTEFRTRTFACDNKTKYKEGKKENKTKYSFTGTQAQALVLEQARAAAAATAVSTQLKRQHNTVQTSSTNTSRSTRRALKHLNISPRPRFC